MNKLNTIFTVTAKIAVFLVLFASVNIYNEVCNIQDKQREIIDKLNEIRNAQGTILPDGSVMSTQKEGDSLIFYIDGKRP
jgi:hypothetical protein